MKSGQFIRGKIDGVQKHFESKDLDKILPSDKLCCLADLDDIGERQYFFRSERALIKTNIIPADNTDGRRGGVINHTVIYQFDRIVTHENEQYIFDIDAFIGQLQAGNKQLKMPAKPVLPDTDSGLIDSPPPIEWEAQ